MLLLIAGFKYVQEKVTVIICSNVKQYGCQWIKSINANEKGMQLYAINQTEGLFVTEAIKTDL